MAALAYPVAMVLALLPSSSWAGEPAPADRPTPGKPAAKPTPKDLTLPGLVIDFKERCVDIEFPHTFLFAGSLLRSNGPGPRKYLSDLSGNVITIATFGDELLCLPGIHGQQNGALMWRVDPSKLPRVGTKVTLRLRPKPRPAKKAQ